MNIILDIDETLIHAVSLQNKQKNKNSFTVKVGTKNNLEIYRVYRRPHLSKFLNFVFANFKTVNIWTAATKDYAIKIMKSILTKSQFSRIKFFNSRQQCTSTGIKPLREIFKTKQASTLNINKYNTIMIDDKKEVLVKNKGNGIVVSAWDSDSNDNSLLRLMYLLKTIIDNNLMTTGNRVLILDDIVPKI